MPRYRRDFSFSAKYGNAFATLLESLEPLYAASAAAFIIIPSTYIYIYDNRTVRSSRISRKTEQ